MYLLVNYGPIQIYSNSCTYNGETYSHLTRFASDDSCNTCTCKNGEVTCTEMDCSEQEGNITEGEALDIVKGIDEVAVWIETIENSTNSGTPAFEITEEENQGFAIHVYESFEDHNATFNWYYVTYDGELTEEF